MMTKAKQSILDFLNMVKHLQVIIISLIVLVLLGYALLQVTDAVNPTASPETINQVKLEQQAKRVRYNDEVLLKIRQLENVETDISPKNGDHSSNPFNTD